MNNSHRLSFRLLPSPFVAALMWLGMSWLVQPAEVSAQPLIGGKPNTNDVVIELFYRGDSEQSIDAEKYLRELSTRRQGMRVKAYDVLKNRAQRKRFWALTKKFGLEKAGVPAFYFFNRIKIGFRDAHVSGTQIEELLTIKAYIRPGCKHCKAGKEFLDDLVVRWPALQVQYFDVVADPNALREAKQLASQYRVQIPSFPCIKVAGRLVVGYQTHEITGRQIESYLKDHSVDFTDESEKSATESTEKNDEKLETGRNGLNGERSSGQTNAHYRGNETNHIDRGFFLH